MSQASERQSRRLVLATERLATLKAQQLMRELLAHQRRRAEARRLRHRRRFDLGDAIERCGFGELTALELVGMLADAEERAASSPTLRLGMHKKGAERLERAGTPAPKPHAGRGDRFGASEERSDSRPETFPSE
jgi:hypothetical protein